MTSSSSVRENPISIWNGDCLELLENIPDNTIDLVLTDPPYFIDQLDNHWNSKKLSENTPNSHIRHLPKGMKFDKKQVKNLYDFYLEVSRILWKKMKPGAYFLSFSSPRLYHSVAMACEIAGFEIRDMLNWTYTQSMPKAMSMNHVIDKLDLPDEQKIALKETYDGFKTPMLKSCFEPVCVAMKPIGKSTFLQNELNFHTGLLDFSQKVGDGNDRVPANIITTDEFHDVYNKNFLVSKPSKEEKGNDNHHLTVKPLHLIGHLVRLFSKPGSLVVDPFLGSGTTAVACQKTGRRCIGIELNPEYFEIASSRLE